MKRKAIRITIDEGTPELRQHHTLVREGERQSRMGGAAQPHMRVVDQRPLDRYFVRGLLARCELDNDRLYRAGERLRKDWDLSGFSQRVVANLDGVDGGNGDMADARCDAIRRKDAAFREVGPVLIPVLTHVVCCDGSAREWAWRNGLAQRKGIAALRLALDRLARHYRL